VARLIDCQANQTTWIVLSMMPFLKCPLYSGYCLYDLQR